MTLPDDMIVDDTAADDAPPLRRIRLGTVDEIAVEMARVYRDMRARKIKHEDGTRLVYVLLSLAKVKESDCERRIEQLEDMMRLEDTGRR